MYAGNQEYLEAMALKIFLVILAARHIQYLGMDLYKQWLSFAA